MKTFTIIQKNGMVHTVIVDDEDYDELMMHTINIYPDKNTNYAIVHVYCEKYKYKDIRLHRYILGITDPDIEVDHRDHNGLNNQRENLRVATHQENQYNRNPNKISTSSYKGVGWNKQNKKWVARIRDDGKSKYLGSFDDEYEAYLVYESAAEKIQGEFKK